MKRILSQILVFSLFMIAPISFSTEKIPNFNPVCVKTESLSQARKVVAGIKTKTSAYDRSDNTVIIARTLFVVTATASTIDCYPNNPHGRAPPRCFNL